MVTLPVRKRCFMPPGLLEALVPIVAIVTVFSFPVALLATFKWFKLRERELLLDTELRKTAGQALEARVQRLESIILALDGDLRERLSSRPPPAQLMESPATPEGGQAEADSPPAARIR